MTVVAPEKDRLTPGNLAGLRVAPISTRPKTMNMLIYGQSGIGKTVCAGSADAVPAMRPVLLIDVEGGAFSLYNTYPDVDVVRVTTWKEMQDLYNELHRGDHKYRTIILDSLTEIQKFSMYNIMRDLVDNDDERDPDVPGLREWGKNTEQIRRLVRGFRDLPYNVIFTALLKEEKDKRGTIHKQPYLSGKLSAEVAAFLDIVTFMYAKNVQNGDEVSTERFMLTGATEEIVAKDRSGQLPLVIRAPNMQQIYAHATKSGEEE